MVFKGEVIRSLVEAGVKREIAEDVANYIYEKYGEDYSIQVAWVLAKLRKKIAEKYKYWDTTENSQILKALADLCYFLVINIPPDTDTLADVISKISEEAFYDGYHSASEDYSHRIQELLREVDMYRDEVERLERELEECQREKEELEEQLERCREALEEREWY